MSATRWNPAKLIAGLACVLIAVLLLLFGESDSTTAGAVAFAVFGLASMLHRARGSSA